MPSLRHEAQTMLVGAIERAISAEHPGLDVARSAEARACTYTFGPHALRVTFLDENMQTPCAVDGLPDRAMLCGAEVLVSTKGRRTGAWMFVLTNTSHARYEWVLVTAGAPPKAGATRPFGAIWDDHRHISRALRMSDLAAMVPANSGPRP